MGNVYVKKEDLEVFQEIKGMDYYDRRDFVRAKLKLEADAEVPLEEISLGYFLRDNLHLVELPESANIVASYNVRVNPDLSFVILDRAPELPQGFEDSLRFWSDPPEYQDGVVYYQNEKHEYMVKLDADFEPVEPVRVLVEGLVVEIPVQEIFVMLGPILLMQSEDYIHLQVPIDADMLLLYESREYDNDNPDTYLDVFVKVSDLKDAPAAEKQYIDLLRYEMLDYGYYY